MDLFLNELSLEPQFRTRDEAIEKMDHLLEVLRICSSHGCSSVLRTLGGFLACNLSFGYTVRHWLSDNSVESEKRIRFKGAVTRAPFIEELIGQSEDQSVVIYEFLFEGVSAQGLGAGYLFESPAVSFQGNQRFANDPLRLQVRALSAGNDETSIEEVINLVKVQDVNNRASWIRSRLEREISSGQRIIEMRAEIFPNLIFCEDATRALIGMTGTEQFFHQVCRHLFVLNSYCSNGLTSGISNLSGISWSDESDRTLNNQSLRRRREFADPAGVLRLCSLHTKVTGGNIRIHFFPLSSERKIIIGYIGPHLPI
jgi:hypothetical protein